MRLGWLAVVCALALAGCRSESARVESHPAPGTGGTGLVIVGGKLMELDAATLRPLAGRAVSLGRHDGAAGLAPDRKRVAVGGRRSLRIIDLRSMKVVADLPKPPGYTALVSWAHPGRLVVVNEVARRNQVEVLVFDPADGRLLVRNALPARDSWAFAPQAAAGEVVFLLHPLEGIGPARLVHVDSHGRSRVVRLARIASGYRWAEVAPGLEAVREVWPALAVDHDGGRAFVVGSHDVVAEVDMRTGGVEYHVLQESLSLADRLLNWLQPVAHAKASDWTQLGALWLGNGRLAVFGVQTVPWAEGDAVHERDEALGFRLVDTTDWTFRMIDDEVVWLQRAGDLVLATGGLWNSVTQERRGIGLRGYELDGTRRFQVLDDRVVDGVEAVGGRALVRLGDADEVAVVDLGSGRILDEPTDGATIPDRVLSLDGR
jgi:hypothetical protein